LVSIIKADNWAVLVAGSNGYWNYRHQSDVCHAYHTLSKNGIPDDHIIVMMYDDIANASENPKKGSMINEPNGPNVYPGTPKDYTGSDVTPQNFLKILKGEYMGKDKKTLQTGPNDNVFIYFTDHGGPGIIAFPNYQLLHVKDLIDTLKYMFDNHKYKQLVFYMEACESGSMFNNVLPNTWKIYAETASNPSKSSYACYYDSTYQTYLADCYSINFLNHTDTHDISTTTLDQQFEDVHKQTTESPVCLYGDKSMGSEVIGKFQGTINALRKKSSVAPVTMGPWDRVSSRDAKLIYLQRKVADTNDMNTRNIYIKQLEKYQADMNKAEVQWSAFKGLLNLNEPNDSDDCYPKASINTVCMKEVAEMSNSIVGRFAEHSIKYSKYLNQACAQGRSIHEIENALRKISKVF
jgi:legumain